MCYQVMQDMLGADLVLDIHTSTQNKSELYEVRIGAQEAPRLIPKARALCPELIWVYPDSSAFRASLTCTLCEAGTDAMILEAGRTAAAVRRILPEGWWTGIFCKMKEMGLWSGPGQGAARRGDSHRSFA